MHQKFFGVPRGWQNYDSGIPLVVFLITGCKQLVSVYTNFINCTSVFVSMYLALIWDQQYNSSRVFRYPGQLLEIWDCPGQLEPMCMTCKLREHTASILASKHKIAPTVNESTYFNNYDLDISL